MAQRSNRQSLIDNVLLVFLDRIPRWRRNMSLINDEEKQIAMVSHHRLGLAQLAPQRATTLSRVQQQRVALARALTQLAEEI